MTDEQEIERIEQIIKDIERPWKRYGVRGSSPSYGYIRALVNAGIGDKKQAVKEFVDRLKEEYCYIDANDGICTGAFADDIDELFTELYGAEE